MSGEKKYRIIFPHLIDAGDPKYLSKKFTMTNSAIQLMVFDTLVAAEVGLVAANNLSNTMIKMRKYHEYSAPYIQVKTGIKNVWVDIEFDQMVESLKEL